MSYFTSQEAEQRLKMHIFERDASSASTDQQLSRNIHLSYLNYSNAVTKGQNMLSSLKKLSRNSQLQGTLSRGPPSRVKGSNNYRALLEDCFLTQAQLHIPQYLSRSKKRELTTK